MTDTVSVSQWPVTSEMVYYATRWLFASTLTLTAISFATFYTVLRSIVCGTSIVAVTALTTSSLDFLRRFGVFVFPITSHHAMYNTGVRQTG
jgi:hypothetical protein